ncbi:MAG: hypothetical protein JOZ91_07645 [Candidatus Eremiobacteraeota bacterium]|nr:hypothetical protein [Candidatus Eremiobacteraeota bacterium]MBV8204691.1 hypothetical protein [Candidatus Eremiobacteraeota bacterium]MBV8263797.1 hypothetical protein [Candidatus Eremiobacteraeota bacterium]MBV8338824.1 hypothetical protein [Candidatus Eremiobacteraeota bacterium]MBV8460532.1 hypothetical protein [Candidatus Eremiobacteraeota bacterium]
MSRRWILGIGLLFCVVVIAYVGCSSSAVQNVHTTPPPPTMPATTAAPQSRSTVDPIVAGTALPIPAIGGFSGSFTIASVASPPANPTVKLTSYISAPVGAPAPQAITRIPSRFALQSRRFATTTAPNTIFWVQQQYSGAMGLSGFPVTSWQVPASDAGQTLALETFDGTANALLDTEFDTGWTGNMVTFPGSASTFAVVAGHTYWWELISGKPTPAPSPSPSQSPSPSPSPLTITSGSPPPGEVGKLYGGSSNGYTLSVSGGTAPYFWTWSAAKGSSLPPGLTLLTLPAEAIVGTPTTAGTFHVIVSVMDSGSPRQHASANYSIAITSAPPKLSATEYIIPTAGSNTRDIISGPNANLWFSESNASKIGEVTTSGAFTEYSDTASSGPFAIIVGPDKNLWFVHGDDIIGTMSATGVVSSFSLNGAGVGTHAAQGIAAGPDGNLWITDQRRVGCGKHCSHLTSWIDVMTTSGAVSSSTSYEVSAVSAGLNHIVAGSDGNLWFVETVANEIGKITTSGVITQYPVPTASSDLGSILALGPDGNIWFCEYGANKVGKVTPGGTMTEYAVPSPSSGPWGITAGPDGNIWFTENIASQVGRITPAGVISEFTIPTAASAPIGITKGPDGDIWFAESGANKIAKFKP